MTALENSALWPFVQLNILISDLGKGGGEAMFAGYGMSYSEDELSQTAERPHQPVLTKW